MRRPASVTSMRPTRASTAATTRTTGTARAMQTPAGANAQGVPFRPPPSPAPPPQSISPYNPANISAIRVPAGGKALAGTKKLFGGRRGAPKASKTKMRGK